MEASLVPDGRIRLVLPLPNLNFVNLALWKTAAALEQDERWFGELSGLTFDQDERWFGELSGLTFDQSQALNDDMMAVRYALRGSPRTIDPRTGELRPPLEPRKTGTYWDELPKMEAENLPDGRVAVTLPQEKLAVFSRLLEASLVYVAPNRSKDEEERFQGNLGASTEEAQELADELRRLNWKMQIEGAKRFIHPTS
jgi:hypothetical protein